MMAGATAENFDIVIVGAGLVGASLAARLNQNCGHLTIALIDAGKPPKPPSERQFDPRVVALSRTSQALFDRLGIWSVIESAPAGQHRACPYRHMQVWDGEGTGRIDFDCRDLHQQNLGFIVENSLLLSHLIKKLEVATNLQVYWGESLTGMETGADHHLQPNRLQLSSGRMVKASLVLAADGANSQVRKLCNFVTREWNYGQQAVVTTVKTEKPHEFTAWQRFMSSGPLAFLPLLTPEGDDHYSSIVWSLDDHRAEPIANLNDRDFARTLAENFENTLGEVVWVDKRYSFPLRQRHAKAYVQPGVALLGDAAHTLHPLAGQGVNLGLQDVETLATEIERAHNRRISLNDFSILRRYQRARLGPNLAMMGAMEGFKQLFGSPNAWLQLLRNNGLSGVDHLPWVRNLLAQYAMGL